MNESLFVITNIFGIICGVGGILTIVFWREMMGEAHLFEFIIILFGLIYVYWAMIMKSKNFLWKMISIDYIKKNPLHKYGGSCYEETIHRRIIAYICFIV